MHGDRVKQVGEFKYLESAVQTDGGSDRDCKANTGRMESMEKNFVSPQPPLFILSPLGSLHS